jgi:hypothetical protein
MTFSSVSSYIFAAALAALWGLGPVLAQSDLAPQAGLTSAAGANTAPGSGAAKRLTLEETRIRASNPVRLEPAMSPIWVEFEGSSALTARLRESVERQGLTLAEQKAQARSSLVVRGDIDLRGGPVFHRGARMKLRDGATPSGGVSGAEAWKLAVDAVGALAFPSAWSVSDLLTGLGHASGFGGWFNRALTGDPRGVCFGEACKTWNQVRQVVVLKGALAVPGSPEVVVGSAAAAQSETVDPDHLVAMASLALLQALGDAEALAFFERHGRSARSLTEASQPR